MDGTGETDWNLLGIGFWCGVLVVSLIQMLLIYLGHNLFAYDLYIMGVAVIAIVFNLYMRKRAAVQ
jgi:hypothetical protein